MLLKGKKYKQSRNDLSRKVQDLLMRNFFELSDFQEMSRRKALKVLKLMAKIENKKQKKSERIQLYEFIMSGMKDAKTTKAVAIFFNFKRDLRDLIIYEITTFFAKVFTNFTFRLEFKKILRF